MKSMTVVLTVMTAVTATSKSFSKALILTSTNPKYDKGLFIDLPVQNMLCTYIKCFECQNKKRIYVYSMF